MSSSAQRGIFNSRCRFIRIVSLCMSRNSNSPVRCCEVARARRLFRASDSQRDCRGYIIKSSGKKRQTSPPPPRSRTQCDAMIRGLLVVASGGAGSGGMSLLRAKSIFLGKKLRETVSTSSSHGRRLCCYVRPYAMQSRQLKIFCAAPSSVSGAHYAFLTFVNLC